MESNLSEYYVSEMIRFMEDKVRGFESEWATETKKKEENKNKKIKTIDVWRYVLLIFVLIVRLWSLIKDSEESKKWYGLVLIGRILLLKEKLIKELETININWTK